MEALAVCCIGALIGATVAPSWLRRSVSTANVILAGLLIFSMGASLGGREGFVDELASTGVASALFCLVPTACSVALVYPLTRRFMGDLGRMRKAPRTSGSAAPRPAAEQRAAEAYVPDGRGEIVLIAVAVGSLTAGVAYGLAGIRWAALDAVVGQSDALLMALMLSVGVGIGGTRGLLARIREHHVKMLVIPAGTILGSIAGGLACAALLRMNLAVGGAIASGLGWYSLSGVLVAETAGATAGGIAFLSNLLREIASFLVIPLIARYLNYPTCIAPGAATSEDTTLPMLIRCTNAETVVFSMVNGIVCSAAVPLLIGGFQAFM